MGKIKQILQLRTRKLGLLILDARLAAGRSEENCSMALAIPVEDYRKIEKGTLAPTLSELEALAFYLDTPLEHFWGNKTISRFKATGSEPILDPQDFSQAIGIGEKLQAARQARELSVRELAERMAISEAQLEAIESGTERLPLPLLEQIAATLGVSLDSLFSQEGQLLRWRAEKKNIRQYLELPEDIRTFIETPIHQPYIQLAMRLSQMSVEKLRAIAETILEITY